MYAADNLLNMGTLTFGLAEAPHAADSLLDPVLRGGVEAAVHHAGSLPVLKQLSRVQPR